MGKRSPEVIMNLAPAYEQWYANTIAEGEQIGITKGKQETARRMLSKNMSLEEIAGLTDLTIAQIQALQAEK
jgi:predicted transposase/invertase (TIGR01784 family)